MLCVSDRFQGYGQKIVDELRGSFVRAEMDTSGERLGKMIRNGTTQKIPNLLVIGENEVEAGTVTMRNYGSRAQQTMPVAEFKDRLLRTIATRSMTFLPE